MTHKNGWHFFMNPGPTNIPDRILRAMDRAHDGLHRRRVQRHLRRMLRRPAARLQDRPQPILGYAATGHGAWEAALVNLFSPGDKVLIVESGYFSLNWGLRAEAFGLEVETLPNDWRRSADPAKLEARLREDKGHEIKAVLAVHNETSTGVAHPIAAMRKAIDAARHPALFCVDTISSLGSFDFRMDEWGVDVIVVGSQKGLMLPTGMAFTGVSAKAMAATAVAKLPRVYWDWRRLLGQSPQQGYWNGTVPVHFFYGLQEALRMLEEEGLDNVFARHHRLAEATRRAVRTWRQNDGPEVYRDRPGRPVELGHRGVAARWPRRRRDASDLPRQVQRVARRRARAAEGPAVPHRPSGRRQRGRWCWARSPRSRSLWSSPACRTAGAASGGDGLSGFRGLNCSVGRRHGAIYRPRARQTRIER